VRLGAAGLIALPFILPARLRGGTAAGPMMTVTVYTARRWTPPAFRATLCAGRMPDGRWVLPCDDVEEGRIVAPAAPGTEPAAGHATRTMLVRRSETWAAPTSRWAEAARTTGSGLTRFDHVTMAKLSALPTPPAAVTGARLVSGLADPEAVCAALALATVLAIRRGNWQAGCLAALAVAAGADVRRRLSRVIARPRPPAGRWLTEPEGFSLPSKHTTLAVLTAGACVRSAGGGRLARHLTPLLAAAVVGASRVYLGVHWPTDIVAGWLFGECWLCLTDAAHPCRP
jgi:membrane-associated phospholipid phosphatase